MRINVQQTLTQPTSTSRHASNFFATTVNPLVCPTSNTLLLRKMSILSNIKLLALALRPVRNGAFLARRRCHKDLPLLQPDLPTIGTDA